MPRIPPGSRESRKKHTTPDSTRRLARMSSFFGRFFQKIMDSKITKMGQVNCKTIVLAAVVSLLARVNRVLVKKTLTAPMAM